MDIYNIISYIRNVKYNEYWLKENSHNSMIYTYQTRGTNMDG